MLADAILFDLDGTLWDAIDGILISWNKVIDSYGGIRPPITREEQTGLMGLQMDEIGRRLFQNEPPEKQTIYMNACMAEEQKYLEEHGGILYPKLRETLMLLRRKYKLCIASNCQCGYIDAFLHAHHMEDLFDDFICYGDTKQSKGKNIQILVNRNGFQKPVYVGDTAGDQQAAGESGVPFIFAAYGFGHVDHCDVQIDRFEDLVKLFEYN